MTDSELIDALGGPARLAERLNLLPVQGRVQRVHNWRTRGIPARIRLDHADVFAAVAAAPAAAQPGQLEVFGVCKPELTATEGAPPHLGA